MPTGEKEGNIAKIFVFSWWGKRRIRIPCFFFFAGYVGITRVWVETSPRTDRNPEWCAWLQCRVTWNDWFSNPETWLDLGKAWIWYHWATFGCSNSTSNGSKDRPSGTEAAKYRSTQFDEEECEYVNLSPALDNANSWGLCPDGYFFHGLNPGDMMWLVWMGSIL